MRMDAPFYARVPNESIEQLTSHRILTVFGNPTAWIFVPTRIEERARGYEASLRNHKLAIIQHKRAYGAQPLRRLTARIDQTQHGILTANFPRGPQPYAFFAFSEVGSFSELNQDFMLGRGSLNLDRTLFIDIHDVPKRATALRVSFPRGQSLRRPTWSQNLQPRNRRLAGTRAHPARSAENRVLRCGRRQAFTLVNETCI